MASKVKVWLRNIEKAEIAENEFPVHVHIVQPAKEAAVTCTENSQCDCPVHQKSTQAGGQKQSHLQYQPEKA